MKTKIIRNVENDVWKKLRILCFELELSVADTLKLLIKSYMKNKNK